MFVIMGDKFYHICIIEEAVLGFVVVVTADAYNMLLFHSWYRRTNVKYTEQDSSISGKIKKVKLFDLSIMLSLLQNYFSLIIDIL